MRVISQDGTLDMPYEVSSLNMVVGKYEDVVNAAIYCCNSFSTIRIAEYGSEEKAKKAMEMLREKYLTRMELDGGFDHVNKVYVQPNYWVLPKVFQFQAEEELE